MRAVVREEEDDLAEDSAEEAMASLYFQRARDDFEALYFAIELSKARSSTVL